MKYTFYAELTACIEISDEDFDILWKCCAHHYDSTVKGLTEQGGFLYGTKNRRTWAMDKSEGDEGRLEIKSRDFQLLFKALEMAGYIYRDGEFYNILKTLQTVLKDLQARTLEINNTLYTPEIT